MSETFKKPILQSFSIPESLKPFSDNIIRIPKPKMHILQPKHTKLKPEEVKKLTEKYNISVSQLPKIKQTDPAVPEGTVRGEVLKIERKEEDKINVYYRVVA